MAYLLHSNNGNGLRGVLCQEAHLDHREIRGSSYLNLCNSRGSLHHIVIRVTEVWPRSTQKQRKAGRHCCCCDSVTSSSEVELLASAHEEGRDIKKDEDGYLLVSEYGWKVRRMAEIEEEMRKVAQVQAQAFHEPVIIFNDLFFDFFQAEVLAGLLYRLRNSPPDRYACLVAEPTEKNAPGLQQELTGVVDITVLSDESVLQHLAGADEYLYVSGIAVVDKFRRRKVATALLKACDVLSVIWGHQYLVLRAYEDDWGARKLYTNAGYRVVSADPPWLTSWIGRRRRVLMIKRTNQNEQFVFNNRIF